MHAHVRAHKQRHALQSKQIACVAEHVGWSTERRLHVVMECLQCLVENKWHFFVCTDMGEHISLMVTTYPTLTDSHTHAHVLRTLHPVCLSFYYKYRPLALLAFLFCDNVIVNPFKYCDRYIYSGGKYICSSTVLK